MTKIFIGLHVKYPYWCH